MVSHASLMRLVSWSATGSTGDYTITAANTSSNLKGYVFNGCIIETESKTFNFGRSWGTAKTAFLNTTINSGKLAATRWTVAGMNSAPASYKEYNTVDKDHVTQDEIMGTMGKASERIEK